MKIEIVPIEPKESKIVIDGMEVGTVSPDRSLGFQACITFGWKPNRDCVSKFGPTAEQAIENTIKAAVDKYKSCLDDANVMLKSIES